jgi:hypothetical protein
VREVRFQHGWRVTQGVQRHEQHARRLTWLLSLDQRLHQAQGLWADLGTLREAKKQQGGLCRLLAQVKSLSVLIGEPDVATDAWQRRLASHGYL